MLVQSANGRRFNNLRTGSISFAWLSVNVVAVLVCGCTNALDPLRLADAQLGVRVKTALVNDPDVGTYPIEVQVTGGVVRLSGRLASDALRQRAVDLARSVAGVRGVESALTVGDDVSGTVPPGAPGVPASARESASDELESDHRLLAVGASSAWTAPVGPALDSSIRVSPLFRLGSGDGLGLAFGFGWFRADLRASQPGQSGTLRVRPVMAGLGYTLRRSRTSVGLSLVGGVAFNSVAPGEPLAGGALALDATNSFAWRPGVSVWHELGSRAAFNIATGYVVTRPRTTFFEDGRIDTRTVRADAAFLKVGLAYKLF